MAQVLVQTRVAIAQPKLPQEVQRQGITTKKKLTAIILVVALTSKKESKTQFDSLYLSNYATLWVKDVLSRINGVGDINIFGSSNYGMRVWLDPEKLKARNLTTLDVISAIQEQNIQVAAGQIGAPPTPSNQDFQYTVTTQGRLKDEKEFGEIIVKSTPSDSAGTAGAPGPDQGRRQSRAAVLRSTISGATSPAGRPPGSPSINSRAPMLSTSPTRSSRRWTSSRRPFPRGWNTRHLTIRRSSSGSRSEKCTRPCSRPASWS